jgi:hypothetical protein
MPPDLTNSRDPAWKSVPCGSGARLGTFFLRLHHFNSDVRAISFALVTADTSLPLNDLILLERENLDRADLDAEDAPFAIDLVPDDVDPLLHLPLEAGGRRALGIKTPAGDI